MQLAVLRPFIQGLDVFQAMFKSITSQIDFVLRDGVEHESIIRVGRMAQRKGFSGILCHLEFVIQSVFAFSSYTKRCATQFTLSTQPDEFRCSRLSVRGACGGRDARHAVGASHSEAPSVQTKQPPREFARRLNVSRKR